MDPASSQEWRSRVEGAICKLETGVKDIADELKAMHAASAETVKATQSVAHSSPPHTHEPRLSPPEFFKGEPDQCRPFITQCEIHFELQPSSFPSERSKVAYAISLLSGKAKSWGTSEWQRRSRTCYNFSTFSKELCRIFDPVLPEREAARRLFSVKQGDKRVTEYIIDFHAISADSRWNEEALTDAFFQGLNEKIKDELATKDYPDSLQCLEDLATRVDLRLLERKRERGSSSIPPSRPWGESRHHVTPTPETTTSAPRAEEPMQLGRSKLTLREKERRRRFHLCFYCGANTHLLSQCPLKDQTQ